MTGYTLMIHGAICRNRPQSAATNITRIIRLFIYTDNENRWDWLMESFLRTVYGDVGAGWGEVVATPSLRRGEGQLLGVFDKIISVKSEGFQYTIHYKMLDLHQHIFHQNKKSTDHRRYYVTFHNKFSANHLKNTHS